MGNTEDKCSILIDRDKETVWNAITNEDKLSQWYVPGSPWKIPNLNVGEKVTFTLMPSVHNNLKEKLLMSLTILNVNTFQEFSLYLDSQQMLMSFVLDEESNGTRVTMNSGGFDQSLANLKALIEGNEIPYI
ncbi:SRPBCC domain-containing protein [Peribacillus butanolivorans]|uniref:SRPBCC domain-containing protein n=1 Tax=Peribacillus butanolivorans TaxID=421767 RepID=UPI002E1DF3A6|nr:SRPBCC domain-containing protein [Peribacillus butanolivorans]